MNKQEALNKIEELKDFVANYDKENPLIGAVRRMSIITSDCTFEQDGMGYHAYIPTNWHIHAEELPTDYDVHISYDEVQDRLHITYYND